MNASTHARSPSLDRPGTAPHVEVGLAIGLARSGDQIMDRVSLPPSTLAEYRPGFRPLSITKRLMVGRDVHGQRRSRDASAPVGPTRPPLVPGACLTFVQPAPESSRQGELRSLMTIP
jgi:hypothetical protein